MAKPDPEAAAHLEWLGYVQPTGLVVSAAALVRAGAVLPRRDAEGQRLVRACAAERRFGADDEPRPWLPDFPAFARAVLGWRFVPQAYAGTAERPIPDDLHVLPPDGGAPIRPDWAVAERDPQDGAAPWQLLVQELAPGRDLDRGGERSGAGGRADDAPHGRMERLLRGTGAPAGLLSNGRTLRLVSAPRGESSGWLDFHVADLLPTAGRPLCAALRLLLGEPRLLALPRRQRLAALLADSRDYQNTVSERLSRQVLHALYELLRGFQAAHDASGGALLREPLADDPDAVYHALLAVVLRLVFLLYAEERDLLPDDETFRGHYSLTGLHERLREDAAQHPDTMDQRFGAWAQLLALFRMVHDGARCGRLSLPPRHGALFDPDRHRFLEGRAGSGARQVHERIEPPLVPDGAVHRVLEQLLVLDGERISYRALDVEHIGSVYETMMGFRLETARGRSAAVRAAKKHGAPAAVNLEALLAEAPAGRAKWIRERTDRRITDRVQRAVRAADSVDALHAALDPVVDRRATPDLAPAGAMVLQPSEERRRSGSHYTPRALTEPIVRRTLEPILARLRAEQAGPGPPRPERILDLRICDPALGSGAFLVEACRQLGDALVESWRAHDAAPEIPPGEDEVVFARREIARRCLYGVDRNPLALDLARLSLWLVTLARDHPLTFLDHALRHGDSLVGLTRWQIEAFHWRGGAPRFQAGFETMRIREHLQEIAALRERIQEAGEAVSDQERRAWWHDARDALDAAAVFGDLALAAFFEKARPKEREALRLEFAAAVERGETPRYRSWLEERRHAEPPLAPFHWEIEFPEVFERENPGFDAIVGNPPFAGKNTVAAANAPGYPDWLKQAHAESHGNADQVAHFFRRAFDLLRRDGAFGLIATNTIAQGDTRSTGLRWICEHGGEIYDARRRVPWPGLAAVVVSVLHVCKGRFAGVWCSDDEAGGLVQGDNRADRAASLDTKRTDEAAPDLPAPGVDAESDTERQGPRRAAHAAPSAPMSKRTPDHDAVPAQPVGAPPPRRETPAHSAVRPPDNTVPAHHPRPSSAGPVAIAGAKRPNSDAAPDHRIAATASFPDVKRLDGEPVERITAFLFHRGGHADPTRLAANAGKSFVGSYVLGMGFTFDDTDTKGVASPLAEMRRLIDENPRNREVIFPYVGGDEVNTSPTHAHHRYVINFRDWPLRREDVGESWAEADAERRRELRRGPAVPLDYPETVAADWPELLEIVESRAKPERDRQNRKALRERWWHYAEKRPGLYTAVAGLERRGVLAISRIGQHAAFTFLPSETVYAETTIVFPFDTHAAFCVLQCRVHEIWARFFSSSMKDDLRYTPSDCFETFPFPDEWETRPDIEAAGQAYHDFRAALLVENDEGLTRTYNRFHDPHEHAPEIARLRDLHVAMDRAVLDAYGWPDVPTDCEFLLDYPIDEEEWGDRKKPYRYRWPDPVRDEVLARLLELNAERAAEERLSGATAGTKGRTKHGRPTGRKSASHGGAELSAESRPLWGTPDE